MTKEIELDTGEIEKFHKKIYDLCESLSKNLNVRTTFSGNRMIFLEIYDTWRSKDVLNVQITIKNFPEWKEKKWSFITTRIDQHIKDNY